MSTKGGISSSSGFSPSFSSFIKGMSVTELGFGGLFGGFGTDVTFLATIDIACGELLFSSVQEWVPPDQYQLHLHLYQFELHNFVV